MGSPWKPSLSVPEVSRLRKISNVGPDEETYCSDRRRSLDTRQPCANPSPVTTPGTKDIGVGENSTPTSLVGYHARWRAGCLVQVATEVAGEGGGQQVRGDRVHVGQNL